MSLKSQWLKKNELEKFQLQSIKKLLEFAGTNNQYYRNLFKKNNIVLDGGILDILTSLPILTKDHITAHYHSLFSENLDKKTVWTKSTGGSTGQPVHFGYTKESYAWRVAMSRRGYSWAHAEPGTKQAFIWGVQLGATSKIRHVKEHFHHAIDRQRYFNCFSFGEEEMLSCMKNLNQWKPDILIGYTNPLYEFALFVDRKGGPKFKPRSIICAAEKVHLFQQEAMQKIFCCPVFNTYGSREFMLIGAECEKHEGLHQSMENLIIEVVKKDGTPAAPGETGRILITDLHNYGMPFIRYEIGDLGILSKRECSCGRGLTLLEDVVGRTLDVIRTPEGKVVPGEFFPHLLKDFPEIYRFQVIQKNNTTLQIKYIPKASLPNGTLTKIEEEIKNVAGDKMKLHFIKCQDIPLTMTGKFRVTISELEDC